jgi:transcriptional regulator with XRE-family HTH domain
MEGNGAQSGLGVWAGILLELAAERTQERFAAEIGVSQSLVSKLLRGLRQPGPKVIRGIVAARPEAAERVSRLFLGRGR